jgi:hypothetical protein
MNCMASVPSKGRMRVEDHLEKIRVKVFKRKPTTVSDKHDKLILKQSLRESYGRRKSITQTITYK